MIETKSTDTKTEYFQPSSMDVFAWPEFMAFAKRIGIDMSLPTRRVNIELDIHTIANIEHTFMPKHEVKIT